MSNINCGIANLSLTSDIHDIFSLPVEVLQIIFFVVLSDTFWASRDLDRVSGTNVPKLRTELQLVCKLWQSFVLSCPRLWTFVDLQFSSHKAVLRAVDLSGTAPLLFSGHRRYPRGAEERFEYLEALRIVAKLLSSAAHRIAALLLHSPEDSAVLVGWSLHESPITPPCNATALQHFELSMFSVWDAKAGNAPDPLWLSILAGAPNLTSFKLTGVGHQQFWATLATSTPITRLRSLELVLNDRIAILDFATLLGRLPELENLDLRYVFFVEFTVETATAALENGRDIELQRLRSLHIKDCQSNVFCLIQKLVLPLRVNIVLDHITMDPKRGDEDTILRCIPRIVASVSPENMEVLSLRLDKGHIMLSGCSETASQSAHCKPGLLLQFEGDPYRPFDPQPTAVHFARDILACLPLEQPHSMTLELPPGPCAVYEHIAVLRPVFARLTHVQACVTNSPASQAMASLVQLLRVEDEDPAPLPQLACLGFGNRLPWCPGCASDFARDLCEVLRARAAGGRPVRRVAVMSPNGLNVPESLESDVRALVAVFEDNVESPKATQADGRECPCKKGDGMPAPQGAEATED
ncbi:hypothetical protein PsYK624_163730 [Phanerochaete sordida]|uniref:F-box domain-containing protein n=1 Tax=Phanerochaete sordida TaxID=48140 RepID=A0A9P3LLT6_9APHY|nr:hypothetical protein PsYK624_163730 [Phanerochaete sordida]